MYLLPIVRSFISTYSGLVCEQRKHLIKLYSGYGSHKKHIDDSTRWDKETIEKFMSQLENVFGSSVSILKHYPTPASIFKNIESKGFITMPDWYN